jgi:hypothetical protein
MTSRDEDIEQGEIPQNWDVLRDTVAEDGAGDEAENVVVEDAASLPKINLVASSWADAVVILAVCTAALLGVSTAGYGSSLGALPWAAALGLLWWVVAAAALVTIRQGTPGMLLAGVHFSDRVEPRRLAAVVVTAVACSILVGLPGLLGPRRSPLALAAGSALESVPVD